MSAAFNILVRLLDVARDQGSRIAALCAEAESGEALLGAAWSHGVYAPAAARILPFLPEPERAGVLRAMAALSLRDVHLLNVLKEVTQALAAAGVQSVALKGPVFAERIFPEDEPRGSGDLDLLIARRRLDVAVEILGALGYLADAASLRKRDAPQNPHLIFSRDRSLSVELHYRASADFARPLEPADLIARSLVYRSRQGFDVRVLAPEDEFIFLALHAAKHNFGLSQLYDLKMFTSRFAALDWGVISRRARDAGLSTPVYVAAQRLRELWSASLPLELMPNRLALRHPEFLRRRIAAAAGKPSRWRQSLAYALLCDPLAKGPIVFLQRAAHFAWRAARR